MQSLLYLFPTVCNLYCIYALLYAVSTVSTPYYMQSLLYLPSTAQMGVLLYFRNRLRKLSKFSANHSGLHTKV